MIDIALSFLISVMASVAAYYICKWLDRDDHGNQPED
ncbi:nitrate reductase [bacterium]|nr:nitrate reductase [bacterium]